MRQSLKEKRWDLVIIEDQRSLRVACQIADHFMMSIVNAEQSEERSLYEPGNFIVVAKKLSADAKLTLLNVLLHFSCFYFGKISTYRLQVLSSLAPKENESECMQNGVIE